MGDASALDDDVLLATDRLHALALGHHAAADTPRPPDPLRDADVHHLIYAFDPEAPAQARRLATLVLARHVRDLEAQPPLADHLASCLWPHAPTHPVDPSASLSPPQGTSQTHCHAQRAASRSARFLSTLSTLHASFANQLLFQPSQHHPALAPELLRIALSASQPQVASDRTSSSSSSHATSTLGVLTTLELLSTLCNDAAARLSVSSLELDGVTLRDWLEELSDLADLQAGASPSASTTPPSPPTKPTTPKRHDPAPAPPWLQPASLWASLILHKLYQQRADARGEASSSSSEQPLVPEPPEQRRARLALLHNNAAPLLLRAKHALVQDVKSGDDDDDGDGSGSGQNAALWSPQLQSAAAREEVALAASGAAGSSAAASAAEWAEAWAQEAARNLRLASLEALAYLTLQPRHRRRVGADGELLRSLSGVAKDSSPSSLSERGRRSLFPSRSAAPGSAGADGGTRGGVPLSSYDLERMLAARHASPGVAAGVATGHAEALGADTAVHYGVCSVYDHLSSYPRAKGHEEESAAKLRALAEARGKRRGKRATSDEHARGDGQGDDNEEGQEEEKEEEEEEEEEAEDDSESTAEEVEARVRRLVDAGAAEALVAMTLCGAPTGVDTAAAAATPRVDAPSGGHLTPSAAVRALAGRTLANLTVPQDKALRGRLIQQGCVRALLALGSAAVLALAQGEGASGGSEATTHPSRARDGRGGGPGSSASASTSASEQLLPCQALARLVITHPPTLVFGSEAASRSAVPLLATLFLHEGTDRLQRFEAALALTNLASVAGGAEAVGGATGVPSAPAPTTPAAPGSSSSTRSDGGAEATRRGTAVRDVLEDRIAGEDNAMAQTSALELLCNLVAGDAKTFARWSGEEEDEGAEAGEERRRRRSDGGGKGGNGGWERKGADGQGRGEGGGRATARLHLLLALCAPALDAQASSSTADAEADGTRTKDDARSTRGGGNAGVGGEGGGGDYGGATSLKARLAASGALATLCSSASACERVLRLGTRRRRRGGRDGGRGGSGGNLRTLNLLARLVRPGTRVVRGLAPREQPPPPPPPRIVELGADGPDDDGDEAQVGAEEEEEDEEEGNRGDEVDEEREAAAEARDEASHARGGELARAELEVRGVTAAHCLAQYLAWRRERVGEAARRGHEDDDDDDEEEEEEQLASWIWALRSSGVVEALKERAMEGVKEEQATSRSSISSSSRSKHNVATSKSAPRADGVVTTAKAAKAAAAAANEEARALRAQNTQTCFEALQALRQAGCPLD